MFLFLQNCFRFFLIQLSLIFICLPVNASPTDDLIESGLQQIYQENYQAAQSIFDDILNSNPEEIKAQQYRCFAHLNLENYDRAIADCSTALQQNPNLTQAYLWRGLAYYRSGNYREAIKNYNQVLAQTPEHPQALYNRGLAQSAIGQYTEALADYNQALQSDWLDQEEKATIYNDRGIIYLEKQQYEMAKADFAKALEINQNNSRTHYHLGCACHYLGEHQTAIFYFTKSLQYSPDNPSVYVSRGLAYEQLNQTEMAIEDLEIAANLLNHQGKPQAAIEVRRLIDQLQTTVANVSYV
jgi:tetratricopeptide (TPR) repeat protein